jgi:hypothetical protein
MLHCGNNLAFGVGFGATAAAERRPFAEGKTCADKS